MMYLIPVVREISDLVKQQIIEAKNHGLDIPETAQLSQHETITESINILQNIVKLLMKTKDEASAIEAIGMSTVTTSTVSTTTTKTVTQVNGEVTTTSSMTSTTTSVCNEKKLGM